MQPRFIEEPNGEGNWQIEGWGRRVDDEQKILPVWMVAIEFLLTSKFRTTKHRNLHSIETIKSRCWLQFQVSPFPRLDIILGRLPAIWKSYHPALDPAISRQALNLEEIIPRRVSIWYSRLINMKTDTGMRPWRVREGDIRWRRGRGPWRWGNLIGHLGSSVQAVKNHDLLAVSPWMHEKIILHYSDH